MTPCQRHRAKIRTQEALERREAMTASPVSFHLLHAELERDVARLRSLPVRAERQEFKRDTLLPRWLPVAERYIADGRRFSCPVLVYCIIWLFDTGELGRALDWADIAISEGQTTPDNFRSTLPTFVADTVLQWATDNSEAGHSIEPYFSRTFRNVTTKWRLHEEIRAKWFRLAGLNLLRDRDGKPKATAVNDIAVLEKADDYLAQAAALSRTAGVKSIRARIRARISALSAA
ncbi:terminase [Escherichia coli]|nr:terminase [Escherichia coli]EET1471834.1 terminase [Escherichia coli]EEW5243968.1 terminase [Escherichia coli]EFV6932534.1 terminase [Escherichia coli]EHH6614520.1 terminase [Escherichia coli]